MTKAVAPISALLLSVGILLTGNGLLGTLLPVRAQIEKFSSFEIGIMGSAYFFGFAVGCLIAPFAVRRAGHIRSFAAIICIASSAALTHAVFLKPAIWWILRSICGFCFAALYMIIESWLNERSTANTRGTIFSIYSIISWTVITLGQLMIALHDPASFPLFCYAAILISLAAVPVAMTRETGPAPIESVKIRLVRLYRASPSAFAGCLAYGLANGSFWALGPVFAKQSGLEVSGIAYFMSITVIAGALGQAPLGLFSDKTDRRKIIVFTCIAAAVAGLGMVFAGQFIGLSILAFSSFYGAFAFPLYSISAAHANDRVSAQDYVETASGLLLIFAIGAVIGPLAASALMRIIGKGGLFMFTAVVHGVTATFIMKEIGRREPVQDKERAKFADSVIISQTLAPIEMEKDFGQRGESSND
jgi:MFS family permease